MVVDAVRALVAISSPYCSSGGGGVSSSSSSNTSS